MKNVSSAFEAASRASEQRATIRVTIGSKTLSSDHVQSCTVSGNIGDGGMYSLGSVEAMGCVLTIDTDALPANITSQDITVYFGYEGVGEVNMGVFRTADSLVKHGGLFTEVTAYDELYWSDGPCTVSFPEDGEPMGLREYAALVWPGCDTSGLPDSYTEVMRPQAGCSRREAISVIATAGGCCAKMSEGRLVFVRKADRACLSVSADDYSDFEFSENVDTVLDNVQVELTRTYEYSDDTLDQFQEASVSFVKATSSKVSAYPASASARKDKYILYISRPSNPKTPKAKLSDVSKYSAAPWYKQAKSYLDSGKLLGIYATSNIAYIGHSCFNGSIYTKMKSSKNTVKLNNPECIYYRSNDKLDSSATNTSDAELLHRSFYKDLNVVGGKAAINAELYASTHTETVATEVYPAGATGYGFVLEPELFHGGEFDTLDDMTGDDEGEEMPLYEAAKRDIERIYANSGFPVSYRGFSLSVVGLPQVELGDVLHMTDVYGNESDLLVLSAEWTYDGGISCTYGSTGTTDGVASSINSAGNVGGPITTTTGSVTTSEENYDEIIEEIAEKAAGIAIEKADELDQLSYLISMDALAAGQMAGDAYDLVSPITNAFRELGEQAAEQAHETTVVKESNSKTIEIANDIAKAVATYGYEMEKSVQRWQQTYTEQLDAWVPSEEDDPDGTYADERAAIAEAYAKLYGANGTPEAPEADSAQGHLNAAKAENVEAATKEAEMRVAYAETVAEKNACAATTAKAQASYNKAKANYDKLKKKTKASKKELDAANTALNACEASLEAATKAEAAADTRCTEASASYEQAKADLAAAEAKVAAAQAEVDEAMNGLHVNYTTRILQTARQILLQAEKIQGLEKSTGEFEVTAEKISSSVSTLNAQTNALMKATNMVQTDSGFTWTIVDNSARNTASSAWDKADSAQDDASDAISAASSAATKATSFLDYSGGSLSIGYGTPSSASTRAVLNSSNGLSFYANSSEVVRFGPTGMMGVCRFPPGVSKSYDFGDSRYITVSFTAAELLARASWSQDGYWYPYAVGAIRVSHKWHVKIRGWDLNPSSNTSGTALNVYLTTGEYANDDSSWGAGTIYVQVLWIKRDMDS